jgi:hypothetical protein
MAITDIIANPYKVDPAARYSEGVNTGAVMADLPYQKARRMQQIQQTEQEMDVNARKQLATEEKAQLERINQYGTDIAPVLNDIIKLPEKQQSAAYVAKIPMLRQIAEQNGIQAQQISPVWNKDQAGAVVQKYYEDPYEEGEAVNVVHNGKVRSGVEVSTGEYIDPQTRQPLVGATKAPTKMESVTGTPEDFNMTDSHKSKMKQKRMEAEQALYREVAGLDYISSIIGKDSFVGGTMGELISLANSAAAQFRQTIGADSIIGPDGKVDISQIDPESNEISRLRKAAINKDSYEAALIELAYMKAKQVDPASKITDKDFAFARKMIGTGADKASLLAVIGSERERAIQNYNKDETLLSQREPYSPVYWNDDNYRAIYGKQTDEEEKSEVDAIADQIFP